MGHEVRAAKPLAGAALLSAIKVYHKALKSVNVTFSPRTSTHFHFNITNKKAEEVMNIWMNFLHYAEPIIFELGKIKFERALNPFCRSLQGIEKVEGIESLYYRGDYYGALQLLVNCSGSKYLSLYFNTSFGTLEFRGFNATTNGFKLLNWINVLSDFVMNAANVKVEPVKKTKRQSKEHIRELFPRTFNSIEPFITFTAKTREILPDLSTLSFPPYGGHGFSEVKKKMKDKEQIKKKIKPKKVVKSPHPKVDKETPPIPVLAPGLVTPNTFRSEFFFADCPKKV